jgi:hypothetical protein
MTLRVPALYQLHGALAVLVGRFGSVLSRSRLMSWHLLTSQRHGHDDLYADDYAILSFFFFGAI